MCSVHSAVKSLTAESFEHFVLDSIVRMAIHRSVDRQLVGAILKCTNHRSSREREKGKQNKTKLKWMRKIKTKENHKWINHWMRSALFFILVSRCPYILSLDLHFRSWFALIKWLSLFAHYILIYARFDCQWIEIDRFHTPISFRSIWKGI